MILHLLFTLITNIHALTLQPGDVLLISFNCYECRVIESETNSPYSHSGVVIENEKHEIKIAQSLGMIALYQPNDFYKNKTPGTKIGVYRSYEISKLMNAEFKNKMLNTFNEKYKGILFDSTYLWDNVDSNGRELLYCSEFIAKFLDNFMISATIPYPLTYQKNLEYWKKYFKGNVPEGVLGNSPASFSKDPRFYLVGYLE